LSAKFLRPLTFNSKFSRTVLQQGMRRLHINPRLLSGTGKSRSAKGVDFLGCGFMGLRGATGDTAWRDKAEFSLQWLG
jgi:hypothetical protein